LPKDPFLILVIEAKSAVSVRAARLHLHNGCREANAFWKQIFEGC